MKYALITGVSSGIGKATAKRFLDEGFFVFGTLRKQEQADLLLTQWGDYFHPFVLDLTDYERVNEMVEKVTQICSKDGLSVLVNNAGVAKYGPMQFVDIQDIRDQFEVNVYAVIYLTQKLLPLLGGSKNSNFKPGRIITISSTSGVFTRPILGPYSASKHALEAAFDAFRRELAIYNIKLSIIQPGPIRTSIWDKVDKKTNPYRGTVYEKMFDRMNQMVGDITKIAIPAEKVVEKIWKAYRSSHPKPRYLVAPKWLYFWLMMYGFPAKMTDYLFYKEIQKYRS